MGEFTLEVVDGLKLGDELRRILRPGELMRDRDGRLRRLPRFFYRIPNWEVALETPLSPHFEIWEFFEWGAFSDDHADRNALVPIAKSRAETYDIPVEALARVIVIGDTPHDVACAVAVGAVPVAVATGSYTVDDLRSTGAPVVLADLSETDRVLRLLVESGSRRSKESPAQSAPSV